MKRLRWSRNLMVSFLKKHYETFLEYTGITDDEFWEVIDSWRSNHIWDKVDGEWKLKSQVSNAV